MLPKVNEELLRREATAKLAREQSRRVHAEVETRAAQAAVDVKADARRAQEARVASLEEMARFSLVWIRSRRKETTSFRSFFRVTTSDYYLLGRQSSPACFSKNGLACRRCSMVTYDATRRRHQRDRAPTRLALLLLLCLVSLVSYT